MTDTTETIIEKNDMEKIQELLVNSALVKPITLGTEESVTFAGKLIPEGYRIEKLPVEQVSARPFAKRGKRYFKDTASLISYAKTHTVIGETTVFVTPETDDDYARVTIIFDDHSAAEAGWGKHQAIQILETSSILREWRKYDNHKMNQAQFADFLEHNIQDIVTPDASELLEVVSTLQSSNNVRFSSAVKLNNGQVQLRYEEEVSATAGKNGTLDIPEQFTIGVPVFENGVKYAVNARLRYRIRDAKLIMFYVLERLDDIVLNALVSGDKSVKRILEDQLGSEIPVYFGESGTDTRHNDLGNKHD